MDDAGVGRTCFSLHGPLHRASYLSVLEAWLAPVSYPETKVKSTVTLRPVFRCHTQSLLPDSVGQMGHDNLAMINCRWRLLKKSAFQEARVIGGHLEVHYHKGKNLLKEYLKSDWV